MQFAQIQMFNFFWGVVPVGFFLWWAVQKRKMLMERFAQKNLLPEIAGQVSFGNYIVKNILLIVVLSFSVLALARPQWGFEWQEMKRQGLDILMVMDSSKSMLTQDIKPNRLERTKLAVKDLTKKLKGDRIGLVAFAGTAFLVCPLTIDYGGFLLALDELNTSTIPRGGTDLELAIKEAIKGHDKTPNQFKSIVLITDGESLEGDALAAAREAKQKGIKIFCIGVGTKEGELIRVQNDQGQLEFLKDEQGNFVKSRLNENILQQIAQETGGVYVRSTGTQFGLELLFDDYLSKMERRDIQAKMQKRYFERFQIPLALALIFLVFETMINRRQEKRIRT